MAIPPVVVEFLAKGIPDVQRAFRSVQQTFEQGERIQTRAADSGARARIRAASNEAKSKERDFQRVAREADRWQRQMVRDAEKAAKAESRAVERAAREKIAIYKATDREHQRALQAGQREAERVAKAEARAFAQAEREKNREAAQWVRRREQEERESYRRRQQFAGTLTGAASRAGKTITGGIQRVGGQLLQLGGGFSIVDAVQEQAELERTAMKFSNSAAKPGQARMNHRDLMNQAKAVSITTGIGANELLAGASAYGAKSGDYAGALSQMQFFGEVSKGTGASMEDVAKSAGMLKVQNKNLDDKAMKQMLLDVIMQGKAGSVEFEDLAKATSKVTRTSASYIGDQGRNQSKLLGLSQIGMRTGGSVEESATMLSNLSADALKHSGEVTELLGKDAFNAKGQINMAPEEFIAKIMEKTGGNLQQIQGMKFGARSMKLFQAVAPTYNDAEAEALKQGKSKKEARKIGANAVLKDINDVAGQTYTHDALKQDVKNMLSTSAEQFEAEVRKLKNAVGEQLLPEFVKLVPVLAQLIPHLTRFLEGVVKVADWALDNPLKGLGAAIIALITKEIVAAQIAETIKKLISGSAPGGGGAPGAGGGGGEALGIGLGMIGQVVAVGGSVAETGKAIASGQMSGEDLAARAAAGDQDARRQVNAARQKTGTGAVAGAYLERATRIAGYAFNPFLAAGAGVDQAIDAAGGKSGAKNSNEVIQSNETVKRFDEVNEASKKAASALNALATSAGGQGGGNTGGSTNVVNRTQPIAARTAK